MLGLLSLSNCFLTEDSLYQHWRANHILPTREINSGRWVETLAYQPLHHCSLFQWVNLQHYIHKIQLLFCPWIPHPFARIAPFPTVLKPHSPSQKIINRTTISPIIRRHRTQRPTHLLGGQNRHVWQIVSQLLMKAGWWGAPLALLDLAVSNLHDISLPGNSAT